jgi:hypothetical protein
VRPGDPVFKLVNSNDWHIATFLPFEATVGWQAGQTRTIFVDDGNGNWNPLPVRIYFIDTDIQAGESYVVFFTNRRIIDFLDRRALRFMTQSGITEGLKVPNTAIVEKTLISLPADMVVNRNGVLEVLRFNPETGRSHSTPIVSAGSETHDGANFINIIAEYNAIAPGDVLALPDRLAELYIVGRTRIISGVYITNTGFATFRRIHLPEVRQGNLNYTILDPLTNTSLRVRDRVATYGARVTQNQMVN